MCRVGAGGGGGGGGGGGARGGGEGGGARRGFKKVEGGGAYSFLRLVRVTNAHQSRTSIDKNDATLAC